MKASIACVPALSASGLMALAGLAVLSGCGGGGGGVNVAVSAFGVGATSTPTPAVVPSQPDITVTTQATGPAAPAPTPTPTPTPMQFKVTELATGLDTPWGLAFLPDGRMLITQRGGQLRLRNADGSAANGGADQIAGLPAVAASGQGGLLDVAVDPAFASNRRIYFSFAESDGTNPSLNGTAVARAELDAASHTLSNLAVIYRQLPKVASSAHFGSRLVFDRNGYLFVTLGERLLPGERGFAQDLTRGNGKVMRITTDGAAAPGNPFAAGPAGAQPAIWSYGHRNPQGAALHPVTGELWTSEHGPQGGDEVNLTLPGRNYGWPVISYGQEYGTLTQIGEGTAKAGLEQPLAWWERADGSAWTPGTAKSSIAPSGMAFYTGDQLPAWKGNLFVGALAGTALWRLTLNGDTVSARERLLAERGERIRDVRQGPDGWLYLLTDGSNGKLLRLQTP
ncbi:PQQ-dependent sugar dehydrogenase [Variovorax sp. J22P168]|uniref:PQQ-dependent sugar dehydrogenase n=1 Tax=Variovorax jilinensis TaxID=3053513 RepID=UPI0025774175|nr:PQQ-dependent sugar dehydrogenase [Variovorax sp. J22P168]MDM0011821.1 PQQ-dependent sugar dehydrogenase [Variovorax sp. J22P168]